jgi:hypothetical protein
MNALLDGLQSPLTLRRLRNSLSSGRARDTHGLSLPERRLARLWLKLVKFQITLAASSPIDEELFVAQDMLKIYASRFCMKLVPIPRPRRLHITIMTHVRLK